MTKSTFIILTLVLVAAESLGQFEKITNTSIVSEEFRSTRAVWGDFDNNGYPDIYIRNSDTTNSLFLNNGDETFTKLATGSIVRDVIPTSTLSKVDINNDGNLDLFISGGTSYNKLYFGNGDGTFTESAETNLLVTGGTSISWGDYDRDGDLDAAVSKYFGTNVFFENNGDGSFTEIVDSEFSTVGSSYSTWVDVNNDGYLDIYSVDFIGSPNLFINNKNKTFTMDASNAIVMNVSDPENQAWGDYNNDGYLDLFIGRYPDFPNEGNMLLKNNGDGTFTEIVDTELKIDYTNEYVEGANWEDYDNDGFLDIYMATSTGRSRLFHNDGDGTFTEITADFLSNTNSGYRYSANWADYTNDGFPDLFSAVAASSVAASENDNNVLLKNLSTTNNWLNVSLKGSQNNSYGIGAKITAYHGEWLLSKRIIENGYGVSDFRENFGLGELFGLDSITVDWPTGDRQTVKNLLPNQFIEIHEDSIYSVPLAPTNLLSNALSGHAIELSWEDENDSSEAFLLFISTDSLNFDLVKTIDGSTRNTTLENLEEQTKYYFKLLSTTKVSFSDAGVTSAMTVLSTPTQVSHTDITATSARIKWTDNSNFEDSYVIELDTHQGFSNAESFSSTTSDLLLENLTEGTDYFVRIKAINQLTESNYSETLSFTKLALPLNISTAENVEVYPNPTSDVLKISNVSEESILLTLHSMDGSLILTKEINRHDGLFSVNLKGLKSGSYIVTLFGNDLIAARRIVKN